MPRIEIELTSARPDGTWTWRAAGARQPKGVLDGSVLNSGAKVGDILRAEVSVEIDGMNVTSVAAPRAKRAEPERLVVSGTQRDEPLVSGPPGAMSGNDRSEGRSRGPGGPGGRGGGRPGGPGGFGGPGGPGGPGRSAGGRGGGGGREGRDGKDRRSGAAHPVATTHTRRPAPEPRESARPSRDPRDRARRDRAAGDRPAGDRPPRDAGTRERPAHDRDSRDRPGSPGRRSSSPSPSSTGAGRGRSDGPARPKRFLPGRVHRDAVLAGLAPEERPVAEQVLRGGLPAVRHALDEQNAKARAAGQPEIRAEALLAMAETLLPRLRAADWRDRADAAAADTEGISLRDLRAVVTGSEGPRDDESRDLVGRLREALERRGAAECQAWLDEISSSLTDGRVVRALRASARPPQSGIRFPTELADRLAAAAGEAMGPDTPTDRWTVLIDAVAASPVRRAVTPRGFPAAPEPELAHAAAAAVTRIPGLATLDGVPQPAPAPPAAPSRRSGPPSRPAARAAPAPPRPPGAIPPPPPRQRGTIPPPPRPQGAIPPPPPRPSEAAAGAAPPAPSDSGLSPDPQEQAPAPQPS